MNNIEEIIENVKETDVPKKPARQKFEYTDEKTAIEVLALAIRRFMAENTGKNAFKYSVSEIARIIADGFLTDILLENENLIIHNRKIINELQNQLTEIQRRTDKQEALKESLEKECNSLMEKINNLKGELQQTDPAFAGAQNSYQYIYEQTKDKNLAARAFDSYLLRKNATVMP